MSRPAARKNKYGNKKGLNCLKNIRTGKPRWAFEKPLKTECVTRKLSPEELAAVMSGNLGVHQLSPIDLTKDAIEVIAEAESIEIEELNSERLDRNPFEVLFCKQLAKSIDGLTEFPCPDGRIDILTEKYLIEVKVAPSWKHAIGQCLVYSHYFPYRQPVIFLIGEDAEFYANAAKTHCQKVGIQVCTSVKDLDVKKPRRRNKQKIELVERREHTQRE